MDATTKEVMRHCNNYFAALCEHVSGVYTDARAVQAPFKGKYKAGDIVRIHGAFNGSWASLREGELYEVVSFENGVLTLDRDLHTRGTWLLIVYCEPPNEFLALCEEITQWQEKNGAHAGLASESIDGYSWSAATDAQGRTGWAAAFADRLATYREPKPTTLYYARNALGWQ